MVGISLLLASESAAVSKLAVHVQRIRRSLAKTQMADILKAKGD